MPAIPSIHAYGSTEERALQAAREAIAAAIEFDVERRDAGAQPAGGIQVNVATGTVYQRGVQVHPRGITLALLVALAVEPHEVSTETLCARLYPQTPGDQAYNALKMAVHRARAQLTGPEFIETTQRGYRLAQDVIVDIRFLPQTLRAVRARTIPKALENRLADMFEELVKGRPAIFADWQWFAPTEQFLQRAAREIGLYVGQRALHARNTALALDVARRLTALNALDEAASELTLRAFLALGDRASALMEFRLYAQRLNEAEGIEPPATLRRLIEAASA